MNEIKAINCVVLFGGGGLVGHQISRQIADQIKPTKIVVCALTQLETETSVAKLKNEFPDIPEIVGEFGNIFVRNEFAQMSRTDISTSDEILAQLYKDVFYPLTKDANNIAQANLMTSIIRKHKPDAVIDCVNTATAISYQDVKSSSQVMKEFRDNMSQVFEKESPKRDEELDKLAHDGLESFPHLNNLKMMDLLLVSQAVPQLVRHVTLLYQSLVETGCQKYIKVGTTGTGGMGVNIPFTHGEDSPSFTLMAKTSVGFAHTGLLFLLARSPGPVIKEIKPGAMIGYKKVDYRPIKKFGQQIYKWESHQEELGSSLNLRLNKSDFKHSDELKMVGIDTGENGFFSRSEYEAITYMDSMEFVTPEEIARNVIYELHGASTGKDVIGAIDAAVMDPSYRAGYIRNDAILELQEMEEEKCPHSVAIGELGPPQLSKFLYEATLIHKFYRQIDDLASGDATEMSQKIQSYLLESDYRDIFTSLGTPILLNDAKTILRGPVIHIPESKVHAEVAISSESDIDTWANKGWVDLRVENMQRWIERAKTIKKTQNNPHTEGSARYTTGRYTRNRIIPGEITGWILSTEFNGSRIKN